MDLESFENNRCILPVPHRVVLEVYGSALWPAFWDLSLLHIPGTLGPTGLYKTNQLDFNPIWHMQRPPVHRHIQSNQLKGRMGKRPRSRRSKWTQEDQILFLQDGRCFYKKEYVSTIRKLVFLQEGGCFYKKEGCVSIKSSDQLSEILSCLYYHWRDCWMTKKDSVY